ncbi:hypothetical protein ACHAW5_003986 [Stephanodiscus triporus]|uniref:ATPase AAA-type core domain-containing protein n=1 Tax=Stephanodiscus triporus TaxID=2934178 RepID=A0ABD3MK87_9STRA
MSSESIDLLWNESIDNLKRLVEEEESHDQTKPVSINDAYHHFAKLYINYSVILSELNSCYESSVQPQKRIDIKYTLERAICRVINLRHLLVKWCPPNPDVVSKGGSQAPFPWEYFDLDKELRELCVSPAKLETTTPVFFREDQNEAILHRNATIARLLEQTGGSKVKQMDQKRWEARIATAGGAFEGRSQSKDEPYHSNKVVSFNLPERAVLKVQSIVRGHLSRKKTATKKRWLDRFVGLRSSSDRAELVNLEKNLIDIREQRRQEQQYCKESYENDLHRLKDVVRDEEGFAIQSELREERIQWITEHTISKNTLPGSFEEFYAKYNPPDDKENEAKSENDNEHKGSKDAKDSGKNKKDEKSADTDEVERPVLSAPHTLLDSIRDCIRIYEERWRHRNVGMDRVKSQHHDVEMAKKLIIRDQVKAELTKGVEEKLLSNILKIKAIQEASTMSSKSKKKDKKGQGKKAKGKKAGKNEKPLPGTKLPGMQDMTVDEMLGVLVQNGLIFVPEGHRINDFIGGFKNGRPTIPNTDKQERWIPEDPSAFQLRKSVMEYCIFPLGSEFIRSNIQDNENVRSILFYGPEGSGKTLMVQTVASEIGAIVIHLASSSIGSSFGGSEGAMELIHMIFTVAKEKTYAPVIIYLDNCHEFFLGKSAKLDLARRQAQMNNIVSKRLGGPPIDADMQRFQKPLLMYKNLALKREDRVLVIGCTNMPESADVKLLRWNGPGGGKPEKQGFFERSLYFPMANHTDRLMLWRELIRRRISSHDRLQSRIPPALDLAAMTLMSDGINCGEISCIVDSVLSENRVNDLSFMPLSEHEFASYFSQKQNQDDNRFLNFTRQMTALDSAWKSINNVGGENDDGGKKKKTKK